MEVAHKITHDSSTTNCYECSRQIKPGEEYISIEYTDDEDERKRMSVCADCQSVIDEFFCGGYTFGRVWENVQDHVYDLAGGISSDCLVSLTTVAREKVCDLIEEVWSDLNEEDEEGEGEEDDD